MAGVIVVVDGMAAMAVVDAISVADANVSRAKSAAVLPHLFTDRKKMHQQANRSFFPASPFQSTASVAILTPRP